MTDLIKSIQYNLLPKFRKNTSRTYVISLLILASVFPLCLHGQQQLTVGSYNVRYDNSEDAGQGNSWTKRCPVICQLIQFNDFDIIGTQEVLYNMLLDMSDKLPGYGYIGVGREDGKTKGEYAPIWYKKSRFELLQSGHFWLSEQTGIPNKGWDAALPRICTWAKFKDKNGGEVFFFFNLHMDHVGVKARRESAKLVLRKIAEMAKNERVILTGDFNANEKSECYRILSTSGRIFDTYELASFRYASTGTFNAYDINRGDKSRIDHVFVSTGFHVEKYGILTDTYRSLPQGVGVTSQTIRPQHSSIIRLPSDHFPIKVVLTYN